MSNDQLPPGGGSWDRAQEFEYESTQRLTLGQVIDGFRHLSDADKSIFILACLPAHGNIGASAPMAATTVAATAAPAAVLAPLPAGHTRDPKTGKVFKLTPKKRHSPQRSSLEVSLATAKQTFSGFLRGKNLTIGQDGKPSGAWSAADIAAANGLRQAIVAAKAALSTYKADHPEEFLPPPNKKTGESSQSVAAGLHEKSHGRTPLGSGTSGTPGDDAGGVVVGTPTNLVGAPTFPPAVAGVTSTVVGASQDPGIQTQQSLW